MIDHNGLDGGWRLYSLNWIPLSILALVLGVCLAASRFSLEVESVLLRDILTTAALIVAGHYLILQKWGPRPAFISVSIAQLKILFLLGSPLTYIAASADFPLQDATFAHWDQLLGLDWTAYLLGGHYFVDVLAGVSLAALAIAVAKLIAERFVTAPGTMQPFRQQPAFMPPAAERPSSVTTWKMTSIGER
jgi:hypothetical protein